MAPKSSLKTTTPRAIVFFFFFQFPDFDWDNIIVIASRRRTYDTIRPVHKVSKLKLLISFAKYLNEPTQPTIRLLNVSSLRQTDTSESSQVHADSHPYIKIDLKST